MKPSLLRAAGFSPAVGKPRTAGINPAARLALVLLFLGGIVLALGSVQAQNGKAWSDVKGHIVWGDKNIPVQKPILAIKDNQDKGHCLQKGDILDELWVVNPKNKGLKWTFVWLAKKDKSALPIHPDLKKIKEKQVIMDQPRCMFVPHALGMRQGQILLAKNSSAIPHNFKWTDGNGGGGNVLLAPFKGAFAIKNLEADEFPVTVNCNIHGWMKAWVRVFDHPYFAVTDENGAFAIPKAPAGDYQLMIWHGSGGWSGGAAGRNGRPITIKGGAVTDLGNVEYKKPKN